MNEFILDWFQEYNFDKDDAVHYKNGDVLSVMLGDKKVYTFRTGINQSDVNNLIDDDIDFDFIELWPHRPMFCVAEFDGIYVGEDLHRTTSLRDAINYSKKYTEAQATL